MSTLRLCFEDTLLVDHKCYSTIGFGESSLPSSLTVFDTKSTGGVTKHTTNAAEQLEASEKLIAEFSETWDEKLQKTEKIKVER